MHVLYVHRNYPAQFGHIAARLTQQYGMRCTFVSEKPGADSSGVHRIQYQVNGGAGPQNHCYSSAFEDFTRRSHAVYEALKKRRHVRPDLIVGHSGFGSTVYLRELLGCPLINYYEWYYLKHGTDGDFFSGHHPQGRESTRLMARSQNAMLLSDLQTCTFGYSPTNWQRSRLPHEYQYKLWTIFDGIDTDVWRRRRAARLTYRKLGNFTIPLDKRIVTYVARGFERMRGFDVFLQIAKRILDRRRDVIFLCVGADSVHYGTDQRRIKEKTVREHLLKRDVYDLDRIHFLGRLSRDDLAGLLSQSDLHLYLTAPFVLSWSLFNALACGCTVLASDTQPVRELIEHGRNGLLAPYHDVDHFTELALHVLDDPKAYQRRLGDAAMQTIRDRYSLERTIPQMLDLYDRAIQGKLPTPQMNGLQENSKTSLRVEARGWPALAARYPWPSTFSTQIPDTSKELLSAGERTLLARIGTSQTGTILELGAWQGHTTARLAKACPRSRIVAVDQWRGCHSEREGHPDWKPLLDEPWESFVSHCRRFSERIIPLNLPYAQALAEVVRYGIQPQAILVNAEYDSNLMARVLADLERLFTDAELMGDHWHWHGVQHAALRLSAFPGRQLEIQGGCWRIFPATAPLMETPRPKPSRNGKRETVEAVASP